MGRALKIVSRHRNPEPRGSEESTPNTVSTRASPAYPEPQAVPEAGFDLSSAFDQRQRHARREPTEENKVALETINRLMVTISHYLSNPLTILLGRVELLFEATENGGLSKPDIRKFVESCKREINRIDLIIKVFQSLCEVRYKTYPPGIRMLDVEMEIKNRLKEIETCLKNEPRRQKSESSPVKT